MLCKNSICTMRKEKITCEEIFAAEIAEMEAGMKCPREMIVCDGSGPRIELSPGGWKRCDELNRLYKNPCEVCTS